MKAQNQADDAASTESLDIHTDRLTVLEALKGLMREHEGNSHILRIEQDETGTHWLHYDVVPNTWDMKEGVDYISPNTITDNDCEEGWEDFVDYFNTVDINIDFESTRTINLYYY
ncbi:hypothetical protein [Halorubrum sp. DTA46]|uniref:hypothetical protein n=1 Tax=Halorubrum sp. DTA46 TaxID=3402162 RepID=UPI003AAE39EB